MAEDKIKLPRSSYEELCKIIKAYGRLDAPASLDQVNSLAGVGKTVVSANSSFLSSIGLIEGGRAKVATATGRKLAHALEHEVSEDIEAGWRAVVEENEFLRKMALAVKIRKTMEESSFVSHIAYSAGEAKSAFAMTGARAVIDILRSSGLMHEQDGKLTSREIPSAEEPETPATIQTQIKGSAGAAKVVHVSASPGAPNVAINIEVRIDAKPGELKSLGKSLRAMLDDLDSRDPDTDNRDQT